METIKIAVEVSVNLSENTQNFIKSLLNNGVAAAQPAPKASVAAQPVASVKQSAPKPTAPVAAPAQPKPVATPAPSAPAAPAASSASKTIEDVRKMLGQKVNEHRDVIKQKLNELGAPSVTKLSPSKYDEMYNFLIAL